jgi:Tfp pilus assembly protein PilE
MNFGYSAITIAELRACSPARVLAARAAHCSSGRDLCPSPSGVLQPTPQRQPRATTQALLVDVANRQAQYLLDTRNCAWAGIAHYTEHRAAEVASFYNVAVENGSGGTTPTTPPTFLIKATPIAGTRQEVDGELRLAHDGGKWRGGSPGW